MDNKLQISSIKSQINSKSQIQKDLKSLLHECQISTACHSERSEESRISSQLRDPSLRSGRQQVGLCRDCLRSEIAARFIQNHAQRRNGRGLRSQDVLTQAHEAKPFFFCLLRFLNGKSAFGADENNDIF